MEAQKQFICVISLVPLKPVTQPGILPARGFHPIPRNLKLPTTEGTEKFAGQLGIFGEDFSD